MWLYSVFFVFLFCNARGDVGKDMGELVMVQVLYRHGDRTPTHTYPTDPYRNESSWPVNWGQLTNLGKMNQYNLGKWLRHRYGDFLPEKYCEKDIYIQSTNVDRTLMSAYTNLAGLYEPVHNNWNPNIKWQPIPVHTIPKEFDHILLSGKKCAKHDKLLQDLKHQILRPLAEEKFSKLMKFVEEKSGTTISDLDALNSITSVLLAEDLYGYQLPNWTINVYPQMLEIYYDSFNLYCYTVELCRLKSGPLIQQLIDHFLLKINGSISQKMWMYSGHDLTLVNVMKALNVYNGQVPNYCGIILLEFYRRRNVNEHFVAVYYKDMKEEEPALLQIPGCDQLCPLKEFINLTQSVLPDDWELECRVQENEGKGAI